LQTNCPPLNFESEGRMTPETIMMKEIAAEVEAKLMEEYGYVGVAEGDTLIMLNSGNTKTITVKIEVKS
jgi:hypothetical protein